MSVRVLRALVVVAALCAAAPAMVAAAPAPGQAEQLVAQGDALAGAGRFADAEPVFRRAAAAAEGAYGPNDPRTITALSRVGLILKQLGSYAGAEAILRDVAAREEAGSDPGRKALALANLADNLGAQRRYPDAEAMQRRALAQAEAAAGAQSPYAATYVFTLGLILDLEGRTADAEAAYRAALAVLDRQPGGAPAPLLTNLGRNLVQQQRHAEAEPLLRRALAQAEAARPQRPDQVQEALNRLGQVLLARGRQKDAVELFQRRLALLQAAPPADATLQPVAQYNLGLALMAAGRFGEAESQQRQAIAGFERTGGQATPEFATALRAAAASALSLGRYEEGERLTRRALDVYARLPETPRRQVVETQAGLGIALYDQGQVVAAEEVQRQALAALEAIALPNDPGVADLLHDLSATLVARGQYPEAEALQRRALATAERDGDRRDRWVAKYAAGLAAVLQAQGRAAEAEPLLRRALDIDQRRLGRDHLITAVDRENLSLALYNAGRVEASARSFRGGCRREVKGAARAVRQSPAGVLGNRAGMGAAACSLFQAEALWGWAQAGGGPDLGDRPDELMAEAFLAAQRGQASTPGQVLSLAAARRAAAAAGAGQEAEDYELLLAAREQLDAQFLDIAAEPAAAEQRQSLLALRGQIDAALPAMEARLSQAHPRYWALRSPQPVSIAALQARGGRDAALLKADEALIVLAIPEKGAKALVFAVSKDKAAWAQAPLTGDEIRIRVDRLRRQLDDGSYTIRDARQAAPGRALPSFDRQGAYELYQALFGAPAIQAVVRDKPSWLLAASGAMNSLPPSLLVTAAPAGGVAGDSDEAALRATAWLVRSKATAILPGVNSLRLMRQEPTRQTARPEEPLLAFADPDFAGRSALIRSGELFPAERYFSDGGARAEQLASLPPLPGTRVEGLRLLRVLGGQQDGLLVGPDATETALRQRNASGRLAKAQVIEFATHGLVWGDFDVAEPSLALAFPAPGSDLSTDDGLLTASEAAGLRLNADWVILSACNTAGPNGAQGDGLTGLASAFLYAGAKALLATHWPVRDDVPPALIPIMLAMQKDEPSLSRAEVLRRATVWVLDDPEMQAYYPGAWAPFVLVGEGG
jgi:CHAT domain-containing protein/tetratricopeptide (TPR) repeat protein